MDPRFAKLQTDPRFVRPKATKNKLVLDERFKEFFDDSDRKLLLVYLVQTSSRANSVLQTSFFFSTLFPFGVCSYSLNFG